MTIVRVNWNVMDVGILDHNCQICNNYESGIFCVNTCKYLLNNNTD